MVLKAVMTLAREVRVARLAKPCREAISDRLVLCRGMPPLSRVAMRQWLLEDLRLDAERLAEIDLVAIQACLDCGFKRRQLSCLVVVIERLQQELAPGHPAASGAAGAPERAIGPRLNPSTRSPCGLCGTIGSQGWMWPLPGWILRGSWPIRSP
ncbi:MAG: hypothetical protein ACKO25_02450 [Cyanobium sp.]